MPICLADEYFNIPKHWRNPEVADLYGRIHARYIVTAAGQRAMVGFSSPPLIKRYRCPCPTDVPQIWSQRYRNSGKVTVPANMDLCLMCCRYECSLFCITVAWRGFFCTCFVGSVFLLYFRVQIGISHKLGKDYVKVYCPKCNDIYDTDRSKVDGGYFGRTFPHFFLVCRPDLLPRTTVSVADRKYAMF